MNKEIYEQATRILSEINDCKIEITHCERVLSGLGAPKTHTQVAIFLYSSDHISSSIPTDLLIEYYANKKQKHSDLMAKLQNDFENL